MSDPADHAKGPDDDPHDRGNWGWAAYCAATGGVFLAAVVATAGWANETGANLLLAVAVIAGLLWASVIATGLRGQLASRPS